MHFSRHYNFVVTKKNKLVFIAYFFTNKIKQRDVVEEDKN